MLDRLIALITIIIAIVVYILTKFNIWITVIAIVACALIFRSLRSMFQTQLETKFPPLTVFFLSKDDLSGQSSKGMRSVVITEGIFFHTETEADKKFILDLIDEYAEKFSESNKTFKYRYNYVKKHSLPCQSAYAACRNAKTSLKVVYRKWYEDSGAKNFGSVTEDVDSYMADETIIDPRDGSEHRAMIQFIFDPNLPIPDDKYV